MNKLAIRAAAFLVGSAIAGCVYATQSSNGAAASTPPTVAVFPGAHHTSGNPNGDGGDVEVHLAVVSLHIKADRYDTAGAPAKVVDFYRKALASVGPVKVAKGAPEHNHIRGFAWDSTPDQITVTAGDDIVAVKPRGSGSEFAIIKVETEPGDSSPNH